MGTGSVLASPGGLQVDNRIRLIYDTTQAEAARREAEAAKQGSVAAKSNNTKVSVIDRAVNSVKDGLKGLQRETVEKINEVSGQRPLSNADGTPSAPPRLSEKDLKLAKEYDQRRRQEDSWSREERNHARRESHLQALKAEKEKAKRMWLKR
jgi:YidC/Oxa1 family membrane protein insertase